MAPQPPKLDLGENYTESPAELLTTSVCSVSAENVQLVAAECAASDPEPTPERVQPAHKRKGASGDASLRGYCGLLCSVIHRELPKKAACCAWDSSVPHSHISDNFSLLKKKKKRSVFSCKIPKLNLLNIAFGICL